MKMLKMLSSNKFVVSMAVISSLSLSACSDSDNMTEMVTPPPVMSNKIYTVTVTNLTANQPMSPVALILHRGDTSAWQTGVAADLALETLAEAGDSSLLATMNDADTITSGLGLLISGMKESIELSAPSDSVDSLSILTMLVNTNDAFAGLNSFNLAQMSLNERVSLRSIAYDAGTEKNTEAKGTIPGPADGGEGFNALRDDVDRVHAHPGVISVDDGLTDSVLNASHRFDNPVLAVSIERIQ